MLPGEQWRSSGESTCLQPTWPGFDSQTRRHMWIEFVGPLLGSEIFFRRVLQFSPLLKNLHLIWFQMTVSPIRTNTQGLKITEDKVLLCNYNRKWLDFQVFLDKDYKPEVPPHNPCSQITLCDVKEPTHYSQSQISPPPLICPEKPQWGEVNQVYSIQSCASKGATQ